MIFNYFPFSFHVLILKLSNSTAAQTKILKNLQIKCDLEKKCSSINSSFISN